MTYLCHITHSILLLSAIVIPISTSTLANAKELNIGTVNVESQYLRENKGDTLSSTDYSYKVTFKNGSNSKTIKTKGYCTG
jgi:hypothetical protein